MSLLPKQKPPVSIGNNWLKSIYGAMHLRLPEETVREFWRLSPLVLDGRALSEAECLRHIWQDRLFTPFEFAAGVMNRLEPFLEARGVHIHEVLDCLTWRINDGSTFPGGEILDGISPGIRGIFDAEDPRQQVLDWVPFLSEKSIPGCMAAKLKGSQSGGWICDFHAFAPSRDFSNPNLYDSNLFGSRFIRQLPRMFGLPSFERFTAICDARPIGEILWDPDWTVSKPDFAIKGERFGRVIGFKEFLARYDIDPEEAGIPEREVILAERDFFCPRRRRNVLIENCVYGAPVFMAKIEFVKAEGNSGHHLSGIIDDILGRKPPTELSVEEKHRSLLGKVESKEIFVYHAQGESLSLNGRHFAKNIPAKILRKILAAYFKEGRIDFEFQEFKRDAEISLERKRANFEIRLARLMAALETESEKIRVVKTGRGRIRLSVQEGVEFMEAESFP